MGRYKYARFYKHTLPWNYCDGGFLLIDATWHDELIWNLDCSYWLWNHDYLDPKKELS
jgi:hypothetical protein